MKRISKAIFFSLVALLVLSMPVLAVVSYRAPFRIREAQSTAYDMLAVIGRSNNDWLAGNGFMESDALDTRIQTLGGATRPHMVGDDQTLTATPIVANSQTNLYYTTGDTDLASLYIMQGYNGYVSIPDVAALEGGNDFEIEQDTYVDTSDTNFKYIEKKRLAYSNPITDVDEISGVVYFDEPVEITPAAGAWNDVDVSAYVPEFATGVLLHFTSTAALEMGARINGCVQNLRGDVWRHEWAFAGLDASKIVEIWVEHADACDVFLMGFTGEDFTYKTIMDDITMAAPIAWADVDISVEAPGATTAIVLVLNTDANDRNIGLRENASADNYISDMVADGIAYGLVGCDVNQIFDGYVELVAVEFYLIGYSTANVTTFVNKVDYSFAGLAAWTDMDVSADAPQTATHIIMEVDSVGNGGGLRRNGSAEAVITNLFHSWAIIECDEDQVIQGYITAVDVDFYMVGYIEGYIDAPYQSVVNAPGYTSGEYLVNTTLTGGNLSITIDTDPPVSTAFAGAVPNEDTTWIINPTNTAPYMTSYEHSVGAVLIAWYEPIDIVANTRTDGIAEAGSDADTIIDDALDEADGYWVGALVTITDAGGADPEGQARICRVFEDATNEVTVSPAFTAAVDPADTFTIEFGTLVDRQGGDEPGRITWGVNPVDVVIGSMVSIGQPVPGIDTPPGARDILPETEVTDWYTVPDVAGSLLNNPLRPMVTFVSDNTDLTELQTWRLYGIAFTLLITMSTGLSVGSHQGITMIAAGVGILTCVVLTIFPMWSLVFAIGMFIGGLVMERSPSL